MSNDDLHDLDLDLNNPAHNLDLDNPEQLLAELRAVATNDSRWGLDLGNDPADRLLALARVTFLAGRLTCLATCDWREQQQRPRVLTLPDVF